VTLTSVAPALPVRDVAASVRHYRDEFGFACPHQDDGFAVLTRDDVRLHLWQAGDDGWRLRPADDLHDSPVRTGAESFLAGTASCRIALDRLDAVDHLHAELAAAGVLHPTDPGAPHDTDFGTREFATVDLDGNLLEFYCWRG
jgi:catechol 2,3-dioxygenase-like lactoylglutathione lyase family enzyme